MKHKHNVKQKGKSKRIKRFIRIVFGQLSLAFVCICLSCAFGVLSVVTNFKFGEDGMNATIIGFAEVSIATILIVRLWDLLKEKEYI